MLTLKGRCCALVLVLGGSGCAVPDRDIKPPPGSTGSTEPPRCGDGKVDSSEACDDGDRNSDTSPDACRTSCVLPRCGDGIVDRGEACDGPSDDPHQMCGGTCKARGCAVGADYPTIQAALEDKACDHILLPPGTYLENLSIARSVALVGDAPVAPGTTGGAILDGAAKKSVVTIVEGAAVTLTRVLIRNGFAEVGGGVQNRGDLTLEESVVEASAARTAGGGVFNDHGTLVLDGSVISGNIAGSKTEKAPSARAGGIYAEGGAVTLKNGSRVESNVAAASGADAAGAEARGGGISGKDASITIDEASAVRANSAGASAGDHGLAQGAGVHLEGGSLIVKGQSSIGDNTATGASVLLGKAEGGGIYAVNAEVTIQGASSVARNTAAGSTTGDTNFMAKAEGHGGGIFTSSGKLLIDEKSVISDNTASGLGDVSWHAKGGGLGALGTLIVIQAGSQVIGNKAKSGGFGAKGSAFSGASHGGGLWLTTATLKITESEVRSNTATSESTKAGTGSDGGGIHTSGSTIEITRSAVSDNTAEARTNGTPSALAAGGGITCSADASSGEGLVTLDESTMSGNLALGIAKGTGQGGGLGGAIYNSAGMGTVTSRVVVRRSSIVSNAARGEGIMDADGIGGAIHSSADSGTSIAIVEIESSTISGNKASGDLGGVVGGGNGVAGAILLSGGTGSSQTHLYLSNATLTANTAVGALVSSGGAIRVSGGISSAITHVVLQNSILAGNTAKLGPECLTSGTQLVSEGYNLLGDPTSCSMLGASGDQVGMDPLLDPLGDNGGATRTHALQPSSPARDAGNPAGCKDPSGKDLFTDQRDQARVGVCDIGAYEYKP